jgi:hypothetical protein
MVRRRTRENRGRGARGARHGRAPERRAGVRRSPPRPSGCRRKGLAGHGVSAIATCARISRSWKEPLEGLRGEVARQDEHSHVDAQAVLTRCWPCSSNSVRLGSSPRASKHVGGLRAFGRGSGHRGQCNESTPLSRLPRLRAAPHKAAPLRRGFVCSRSCLRRPPLGSQPLLARGREDVVAADGDDL